jgi:carbonic anhydrase
MAQRDIRDHNMATAHTNITADEGLARLVAGNERFCSGQTTSPPTTRQMLDDLAQGQSPYVTILGCSDSRVSPERVFDAGLGEMFVIRVAGNVFSPEIAGSLQYAGAHLRTPLFVVLGHESCGAVAAALEARSMQAASQGVEHRRHIQILLDSILSGLPECDPGLSHEAQLSLAVESNVRWTVRQICTTPEARAGLRDGRAKVVGAIYELASGRVRFLRGE